MVFLTSNTRYIDIYFRAEELRTGTFLFCIFFVVLIFFSLEKKFFLKSAEDFSTVRFFFRGGISWRALMLVNPIVVVFVCTFKECSKFTTPYF